MKRLIFLVFIFSQILCYSQDYSSTLLSGWTIAKDTTIDRKFTSDYDWAIQISAASQTGTANSYVKIYHKLSGMDWVLYDINAIDTLNTTNYSHIFIGNDIIVDSLRVAFYKNGVTGGTLTIKMNAFKNKR